MTRWTDGPRRHRMRSLWSVPYRADTLRSLGRAVIAVPLAVAGLTRALARSRDQTSGRVRATVRAARAVPVAVASTVLVGLLGYLVLINVLAYPLRPLLGLHGVSGGIWTSQYADSWGGPTLAGAWAVHAGGVLLLVLPLLAWPIRGLDALQRRLTTARAGTARAGADIAAPVAAPPVVTSPAPVAPVRALSTDRVPPSRRRGRTLWTVTAAGVALLAFVALSLASHRAGIGDNLLWTPRDLASSAALAITLAPLAGLAVVLRTGWRPRIRQHR